MVSSTPLFPKRENGGPDWRSDRPVTPSLSGSGQPAPVWALTQASQGCRIHSSPCPCPARLCGPSAPGALGAPPRTAAHRPLPVGATLVSRLPPAPDPCLPCRSLKIIFSTQPSEVSLFLKSALPPDGMAQLSSPHLRLKCKLTPAYQASRELVPASPTTSLPTPCPTSAACRPHGPSSRSTAGGPLLVADGRCQGAAHSPLLGLPWSDCSHGRPASLRAQWDSRAREQPSPVTGRCWSVNARLPRRSAG